MFRCTLPLFAALLACCAAGETNDRGNGRQDAGTPDSQAPTDDLGTGDDDGDVPDEDGSIPGEDGGTDGGARTEECNGVDDDGDGRVDELCACASAQDQPCYPGNTALAGVGACALGSQMCVTGGAEFGSWSACTGATPPGRETCNDIDDNCNGVTDEGCNCALGETLACYEGTAGTEGVGVCRAGVRTCVDGAGGVGRDFGDCMNAVLPDLETCGNADDEDCDGSIDEGCVCTLGEVRPCYSGAPGTEAHEPCAAGTQPCVLDENGATAWGACGGDVLPDSERCDGIDNDCDGTIDNGCQCPPASIEACFTGPASARNVGSCRDGTKVCIDGPGGVGSYFGDCEGEKLPSAELCNGQDDNCNGTIDEGCTCRVGTTGTCYTGRAGTVGVGLCRAGTATCIADGGSSRYDACMGSVVPATETCDQRDEDCDSRIDEGACRVAPVAVCPADSTAIPLTSTTVRGSGTDADGRIVGYSWVVESAPSGAGATLGSPSSATTSFRPQLVGEYTLRLTVTDDSGLTASCTTKVRALGQGIRVHPKISSSTC